VLVHPAVVVDDRAHLGEHSLEVQLPFLLENARPVHACCRSLSARRTPTTWPRCSISCGAGDETLVV
jgi:AmmeMemoRadiSam system protein B